MKIKIINKSNHPLPSYQTSGSAGMDVCAYLDETVSISAGERVLIPTGLFLELPNGYEAQIRPRSGIAIKQGITCLNSPGTIDSDYRGEIKVILINHSNEIQTINNGDRIAQMIIAKYETINWELSNEIDATSRNEGGFGSTGKQ